MKSITSYRNVSVYTTALFLLHAYSLEKCEEKHAISLLFRVQFPNEIHYSNSERD